MIAFRKWPRPKTAFGNVDLRGVLHQLDSNGNVQMKIAKIALATALIFGSIAAASAQGGGGGGGGGAGGGGGNSPAATGGQGASSSPGAANPGATMNDPKSKEGSGSGSAMKHETMPKDHMKK